MNSLFVWPKLKRGQCSHEFLNNKRRRKICLIYVFSSWWWQHIRTNVHLGNTFSQKLLKQCTRAQQGSWSMPIYIKNTLVGRQAAWIHHNFNIISGENRRTRSLVVSGPLLPDSWRRSESPLVLGELSRNSQPQPWILQNNRYAKLKWTKKTKTTQKQLSKT